MSVELGRVSPRDVTNEVLTENRLTAEEAAIAGMPFSATLWFAGLKAMDTAVQERAQYCGGVEVSPERAEAMAALYTSVGASSTSLLYFEGLIKGALQGQDQFLQPDTIKTVESSEFPLLQKVA